MMKSLNFTYFSCFGISFILGRSGCSNIYLNRYNELLVNSAQKKYYDFSKTHLSNRSFSISRAKYIDNSAAFNVIEDILSSNESLYNKQLKIENTFRYFLKIEIEELLSKKSFLGNDNIGLRFLIQEINNLKDDIRRFVNDISHLKHKPYIKLLMKLDPTLILSLVLGKVIPFSVKFNDIYEQPVHELLISIGSLLFREVFLDLYYEDVKLCKIKKEDVSLNEYIVKNNLKYSEDDAFKLGLDMIIILSRNSSLIHMGELRIKKNESKRYIYQGEDFDKILDNITLLETREIPMIIKPIEWEIGDDGYLSKYGGTILNSMYQVKPLRSITVGNEVANKAPYTKSIVDAVNNISGTEFCINKELLNLILTNEKIKDINESPLIYMTYHPNTFKIKQYKDEGNFLEIKKILAHNSKYLNHISVINIAKLMSKVEGFYNSVFIDWRGRFYTSNCELNIQGGELARSLILFKDGEPLSANGLKILKIYTANAYGIDKKSKNERIMWVNDNLNDILKCPECDLWKSAEEPLMFLACCLELKGYYKDPNNFISRLPILMDATCNGLQHLTAIARDITLAEKVNLMESNIYTCPRDVYGDAIIYIKDAIRALVDENKEYSNLGKVNITRALIKRGIMTITYGVTIKGILEQLISNHFVKIGLKDNHYLYQAIDSKMGDVILTYKDLYQLSVIIYKTLFIMHPSLNNIMTYFQDVVKLLNVLNLPIKWLTPHGLILEQKYIKYTSYDINNYVYKKRYKIVLRKPALNDNKEVEINTQKQINSFIPNFIHSMDGSNITLLLKLIREKYPMNFCSIHDCFATQANKADLLAHLVKETFIKMYADGKFIDNFHDYILLTIKNTYDVKDDCVYIYDKHKVNIEKIPSKPILGNFDVNIIKKSEYFLS